jgi:hypothetical protein
LLVQPLHGRSQRERSSQRCRLSDFLKGENVAVDYRWADNQIDRPPTLAAGLVQRQVTLIVAGGSPIGPGSKDRNQVYPRSIHRCRRSVKLGLVTNLSSAPSTFGLPIYPNNTLHGGAATSRP